MVKVGITGGIGSGKSTICKVFEILGIPTFKSDNVAINLYREDEEVIDTLRAWYGKSIYSKEGLLDKKKLAGIIYNDQFELKRINALIHPKVREKFVEWTDLQTEVHYVLNESALLFETGISKAFDQIINVAAPLQIRIDRIIIRDARNRQEILDIASKQMGEEERINRADFTIHNDDKQLVIPQVLKIHSALSVYTPLET